MQVKCKQMINKGAQAWLRSKLCSNSIKLIECKLEAMIQLLPMSLPQKALISSAQQRLANSMTTLAGRPCMKIRSQSPSTALCHPIECQQIRLSERKALSHKILALWRASLELAKRFATLIRSLRRAFQVNSLSAREQQRRLHS